MKYLFSIIGVIFLLIVLFFVWFIWLEPFYIEKQLLKSSASRNVSVAEALEKTRIEIGGERLECYASDVAVACKIFKKEHSILYLWGINSKGFYPANGRTLRLCPDMAHGVDPKKYSDDDIIGGEP